MTTGLFRKPLFLIALLFVSQVYAASKGTVTASSLRIRSSPDLAAPVVGNLQKGNVAVVINVSTFTQTIEGKTNQWCQVIDATENMGWVFCGFLATSDLINREEFTSQNQKNRLQQFKNVIDSLKALDHYKIHSGFTISKVGPYNPLPLNIQFGKTRPEEIIRLFGLPSEEHAYECFDDFRYHDYFRMHFQRCGNNGALSQIMDVIQEFPIGHFE